MNFISYKNTKSKPCKSSAVNLNKYKFQPPPGFVKVNSVPLENNSNQVGFVRTVRTDSTRVTNHRSASVSRSATRYNSTIDSDVNTVILALAEGRGHARGEVGIAAISINCPSLVLCQLSDNFWYIDTMSKIQVLNPSEILVPDTFCDQKFNSKLMEFLQDAFPTVPILPVPRKNFNDTVALAQIDNLCLTKYKNIRMVIERKYYALSAASALIHYLRFGKSINFVKNCLKLDYQSKCDTMMIDIETSNRLELLYPISATKEKRASIYGIVNNCVTHIGRRHLRASILEPSCNLAAILSRQDCIKQLIEDKDMFMSIEMALDSFVRVDRLLKLSICIPNDDKVRTCQIMISLALQLKCCLEKIPYLCENLKETQNSFLISVRTTLDNRVYTEMLRQINKTLNPEAQMYGGSKQHFNRLYSVQPNQNEMLDTLRNLYAELVDKIRDIVADFSVQTQLPLRMSHTVAFGFHIQLVLTGNDKSFKVPDALEELQRRGKLYYLTTKEVAGLNHRINKLSDEIQIISNSVISKMLVSIREDMDSIYNLVGVITDLDIVQSLTKISMHPDYTCPVFGADMKIIDAVHPLLDQSNMQPNAVTNNVIATPEYNFFVITGPNMAGKTIYIKMIATIQIMAQLGCFVPAKQAQLRICDKLFSRIGFQDAIEQNASSFTMEMREMEYICRNLTSTSLVVIDELCRSTNVTEGEILAWCFCEKLCKYIGVCNTAKSSHGDTNTTCETDTLNNGKEILKLKSISRPFIFVTTHFLGLTKLAYQYPNVTNLNLSADERFVDNKLHLTYKYRVEQGVTEISGYGIALARCLRFPRAVLDRAEEMLRSINDGDHENFDFGMRQTDAVVSNNAVNPTGPSIANANSDEEMIELDRKFHDMYADLCITFRSYEANEELTDEQFNKINEDLENFIDELSDDFKQLVANESISKIINTTCRSVSLEESGSLVTNMQRISVSPAAGISENSSEPNTSAGQLDEKSYHSLLKRLKLEQPDCEVSNMKTGASVLTDDSRKSYLQQGDTLKSILFSDNDASDSDDDGERNNAVGNFSFFIQGPEPEEGNENLALDDLMNCNPIDFEFDLNHTNFVDIF